MSEGLLRQQAQRLRGHHQDAGWDSASRLNTVLRRKDTSTRRKAIGSRGKDVPRRRSGSGSGSGSGPGPGPGPGPGSGSKARDTAVPARLWIRSCRGSGFKARDRGVHLHDAAVGGDLRAELLVDGEPRQRLREAREVLRHLHQDAQRVGRLRETPALEYIAGLTVAVSGLAPARPSLALPTAMWTDTLSLGMSTCVQTGTSARQTKPATLIGVVAVPSVMTAALAIAGTLRQLSIQLLIHAWLSAHFALESGPA